MTDMAKDPKGLDPRIRLALANGVATVTISQPAKRNAVAPPMWDAIAAIFEHCSNDEAIRAVVLTGEGDAFCSGSDVDAIAMSDEIGSGLARLRRGNRMIRSIYNCEKPVIAAVRGPATGVGLSLAMACDFIIAAENAKFGGGFLKIGLIPDGGAIFFLSRLLGEARAKELVYTSRLVLADEAVSMGLALQSVPLPEMEARVAGLADQFARSATTGIALAKRMFRASLAPSIEQFFDQEEMAQICAKSTNDFHEGVKAFQEKRAVKFTGT